jgi:hypothetical protein
MGRFTDNFTVNQYRAMGNITSTNSLVGTSYNENIGYTPQNYDYYESGVATLANGNYVVTSPYWDNGSTKDAGSVTWGNGSTGEAVSLSYMNSAMGYLSGSGPSILVFISSASNSFYISFPTEGSGRIVFGSQSSGFGSISGSLNSGGGSIALQASSINLQAAINTTTANAITLTANSLNLTGNVNATTTGNITIRTLGANLTLGNGMDTATNLQLSQGELSSLTAGTLTIGSNTTGSISLTNNLNWPSNLVLSSNATNNGTLSNANQVFTQGSNNITAVGKISIAGVALAIAISAGNDQSTTIGTDFANLMKVQATDSLGNPVPNVAVTFTVNTNGASGNFASATAVKTDATGYATAPKLTANTVSGVFTVTASATGLSPLTFTLTNKPGVATSITIVD